MRRWIRRGLAPAAALCACVLFAPAASAAASDFQYWSGSITFQHAWDTHRPGAPADGTFGALASETDTGTETVTATVGKPLTEFGVSDVVVQKFESSQLLSWSYADAGIPECFGSSTRTETGASGHLPISIQAFDGSAATTVFPSNGGPDQLDVSWSRVDEDTCGFTGTDSGTQTIGFATAFACGGQAELPRPTRRPDGLLHITGSRTVQCAPDPPKTGTISFTVTADLVEATTLPPATLTVSAVQFGVAHGSVTGAAGVVNCAVPADCAYAFAGGTVVHLAALPGLTSHLVAWTGCDKVVGQQCTVTLKANRTVFAWFGYDFIGQADDPDPHLFSDDHKSEMAENGAKAAEKGTDGCMRIAVGLAALRAAGPAVVTIGPATREVAALQKLIEDALEDCSVGLAGTIWNGVRLKVDPPDPAWRQAAYAEALPRAKTSKRCPLKRNCARYRKAAATYAAASKRAAELDEALAVASNRFGNAVGAHDKRGMLLHRATMRTTSGMLATALAVRDAKAKALAAELRRAGMRKVVITRRAAAASRKALMRGRGIPGAAIARLVRKHLVTSAAQARADIRAQARRVKPAAFDVLRSLKRPTKTVALRAAASRLELTDLAVLLGAFHADLRIAPAVTVRHNQLLGKARACNTGSAPALRALAKDVVAKTGLGGEPGLQVAFVANTLAAKGVAHDAGCI